MVNLYDTSYFSQSKKIYILIKDLTIGKNELMNIPHGVTVIVPDEKSITVSGGRIDVSGGRIDVQAGGLIIVSCGEIYVYKNGKIDVSSGRINISGGTISVSQGRIDVPVGGLIDVQAGGAVIVSRGAVIVSRGKICVQAGGLIDVLSYGRIEHSAIAENLVRDDGGIVKQRRAAYIGPINNITNNLHTALHV